MKKLIILILLLFCFQVFSQNKKNDTIFVQYHGDTELIKMKKYKGTDIRGFAVLWDRYKTKESRDNRLKYLREHGGGVVNFYIGFTGDKNYIMNGDLNKIELNIVEDISKRKIIMGYKQKVIFIEKIGCERYKFHETNLVND
jgi:hypothetical protein